jgi:hypothetical protein
VHREFTPEAVFPESLDDHTLGKSSRFGRCAAPLPRSVPESRARLEAFSIPDVLQPAPFARRREDALAYVRALVTIELNASDSNPICCPWSRLPSPSRTRNPSWAAAVTSHQFV